ncbi:hypothetical protein FQR65_LT07632 [Abscondita terminalis]|nr:hypothetical protein FQR65_LT07632 [Abscondita terminalis]
MINWADFIAGWVGGICGLAVGHPFDTIKTRQQSKGLTLTKAFRDTFKHEGLFGFYHGFSMPFLTVGPANAVFFFTYAETLKLLQPKREDVFRLDITHPEWKWNAALAGISITLYNYVPKKKKENKLKLNCFYSDQVPKNNERFFMKGLIGGFVQVFVTCPVELIKTVMQTSVMKNSTTPYAYKTTREAIRGIYQLRGLNGFYRGCVPMLLRDVPASAIYTLVYESLLPRNREANMADLIFAGGLAGSASWSIIVPFDVVKSRIQSDNMVKPRYKSMTHCAKQLYEKHGWQIFTKGFCVTIIRAFPVNACIFVTYELCLALFKNLHIT